MIISASRRTDLPAAHAPWLVNRFREEEVGRIDIVSSDNFQAAYRATQYLIRSGHKRIALAAGREDELFFYRERHRAYRQALEDAGLPYDPALIMYDTSVDNCFYHQMRSLMQTDNPPDAVFCTSDPKAFEVMHALHDMGRRIPADVSVMGFDNVSLSSMIEPPLTTMSQHLYEMGVVAAKNLIQQINYKEKNNTLPPPNRHVLDVDLIVRRSTR